MSPDADGRPRLLLVGGGGGLVGRNLLVEFQRDHQIRSVHRRAAPEEADGRVEWVPSDISTCQRWDEILDGVDLVINVAWYRTGRRRRFERLYEGLARLLEASVRRKLPRFVQISVPPAPDSLESSFPYLTFKRRFDRELAASGLSFRIVRPTMLFGPRDVLVGAMLHAVRRYPFFPMFGDGRYHVSPLAVRDLARIVRREAESGRQGTVDVGGPRRYEYRELTDLIFRTAGKRPRYWSLSERGGIRLARLLESMGSSLLYAYEVEWLVSDMLGLPPYQGLPGGLEKLETYLGRPLRS